MRLLTREFFACILAIFLVACSPTKRDQLPEIIKVDRVIPYHIVKEGESVGSIASGHSMTRADLIKLNGLVPPYQLYNGQRLVVTVKVDSKDLDTDVVVEETTGSEEEPVSSDSLNTTRSPTKESPRTQPVMIEDTATIDEDSSENLAKAQEIPEKSSESDYVWPIADGKSKISQTFKNSSDGGIIMQASAGTPVKAIADGIIRIARALDGDASSYGKTVIILHSNKNKLSVYSHLQEYSVKANQRVRKGDVIGKVGKSGNAKSPQLYLQIFDVNKEDKSRISMDPEKILP